MNELPEVLRITITRSLKVLSAVPNCSFKVVLPDGEIILHDPTGALNEHKGKRKGTGEKRVKLHPGLPHGGLTNYIKGFVDDMKVGDVRLIPFTDPDTKMVFNGQSLSGCTASCMTRLYGKKNYTTFRNDLKQCVEVYLAGGDDE
jgi:hypothetical protein